MSMAEYLPETARATFEDFSDFIDRYRCKLRNLFTHRADLDDLGETRGLPPFVLREIQSCTPLAAFVPEEYGGRGAHLHECLSVLEASSYESLPLSLMMGINGGLFLQPVAKYGHEDVKEPIIRGFLEENKMGGLMITEPDHGTDALNMQTNYRVQDDHLHVRGLKHWAGLTGWADYWLVTARKQNGGNLSRDIDFLVVRDQGSNVEVEEFYRNLGLYMLPYGRNRINARVSKKNRLIPDTTGIKMMLDVLHRSRLQFPGMAMGFLRRMLDEAVEHCRERVVGGKNLFEYDQVRQRLTRLQASVTACSAMCLYTSENAALHNNVASHGISSNAIKSVVTDMMHDASQSLLQLVGAKGYRTDHIAGRALVDSRPFQIFEGSNDVLYSQIAEGVLKKMRARKERNLFTFLDSYDLTSKVADYFEDSLDVEVDLQMPQRKLVELGEILGRIISMEFVANLGERGFHQKMVANCLSVFRQEVQGRLSAYRSSSNASVVEDYKEESSWLDYVVG